MSRATRRLSRLKELRPSDVYHRTLERFRQVVLTRCDARSTDARHWPRGSRRPRRLKPFGANSLGNKLTVYAAGDDAFPAMWRAIAAAQSSVFVETYTLGADAGAVAVRVLALTAVADADSDCGRWRGRQWASAPCSCWPTRRGAAWPSRSSTTASARPKPVRRSQRVLAVDSA